MSKREIDFYIFDVLISIIKIEKYIKGKTNATELLYDCKSWDAVMRELEILAEAMKKLLEYDIVDSEKRKIVNFRNIIVHNYFGIDLDIVWDVLINKIPILKNEIINIINSLKNKNETIECFMKDNHYLPFVIKELAKLKD